MEPTHTQLFVATDTELIQLFQYVYNENITESLYKNNKLAGNCILLQNIRIKNNKTIIGGSTNCNCKNIKCIFKQHLDSLKS